MVFLFWPFEPARRDPHEGRVECHEGKVEEERAGRVLIDKRSPALIWCCHDLHELLSPAGPPCCTCWGQTCCRNPVSPASRFRQVLQAFDEPDRFISTQIVSDHGLAELVAGAGDHPGAVVGRLLPQTEEMLEPAPGTKFLPITDDRPRAADLVGRNAGLQ